MSRTFRNGERRIRVRGVRRDPAELRRLARALIELAQAQAEADAQHERETRPKGARVGASRPRSTPADPRAINKNDDTNDPLDAGEVASGDAA